ncbi:hypothetical protein LTR35_017313 [Friedmanniomyces endolithicus]|nr:hypothetical protein LTS09_017811 [Friedmanniomyces endolithicus]KAK0264618.1 hypothetical protein LTR35_017313 [Friedmanniomyces endolithicus]KAK0270609.1 hypothetical protein LTS00_016891 [Friedmanniomyces endolithicus]KAK0302756.1 hypothetical protein LTR01_008523 [Friedmanniomyces endolithicus]KAK0970306.1 hypothetical protein LTR54_017982 [Friedmanniomyces endolithicus]
MLPAELDTSTQALTPSAPQSPPVDTASASVVPLNVCERISIPGPQEAAIRDYVKWQQEKVESEHWISQFVMAGDILSNDGYRLGVFYEKPLIKILLEGGVKCGIALSFHNDITDWLPEYRRKIQSTGFYDRETPGLDSTNILEFLK